MAARAAVDAIVDANYGAGAGDKLSQSSDD